MFGAHPSSATLNADFQPSGGAESIRLPHVLKCENLKYAYGCARLFFVPSMCDAFPLINPPTILLRWKHRIHTYGAICWALRLTWDRRHHFQEMAPCSAPVTTHKIQMHNLHIHMCTHTHKIQALPEDRSMSFSRTRCMSTKNRGTSKRIARLCFIYYHIECSLRTIMMSDYTDSMGNILTSAFVEPNNKIFYFSTT